MKICITSSAGGHILELLKLLPAIKDHKRFFVVADRQQSRFLLKNERKYLIEDTKRNPLKLIKNFFISFSILLKERPDVIMSTGAATAMPTIYAGKLLGSKIIFIESMAAVNKPSLSGRFAYPVSDLFIVQWKPLLKYYKKAVYGGQVA